MTPAFLGPRLSRRSVAFGSATALLLGRAAATSARPPYDGPLAFSVFRNGAHLGEQRMTFEAAGDDLKATTHVEFAVQLGPVTLYRYRHEAVEQWQGGRFSSLQTHTNSNGKLQRLSAMRRDGAVQIAPAGAAPLSAPEAALPFTHWNRAIAKAPLFDPQDGRLLSETAREVGAGQVRLADGRSVGAQGIAFSGSAEIEDWYEPSGLWTGLRGKLKDGSTLEYRRL